MRFSGFVLICNRDPAMANQTRTRLRDELAHRQPTNCASCDADDDQECEGVDEGDNAAEDDDDTDEEDEDEGERTDEDEDGSAKRPRCRTCVMSVSTRFLSEAIICVCSSRIGAILFK
jgi:hypothetical protein